MIKKRTLIKVFTLIVIILGVTGCFKSEQPAKDLCSSDCITLKNDVLEITANTNEFIVENIYQISFKSKVEIENAKLVSLNMDMGDIPLPLNNENANNGYSYNSQVIFGVCSEPVMQWQLIVNSKDNTYSFNIISKWQGS